MISHASILLYHTDLYFLLVVPQSFKDVEKSKYGEMHDATQTHCLIDRKSLELLSLILEKITKW